MGADVCRRICDWLDCEGVSYRLVRHGPTRTSQESADARGEDIRVGGKALLLKVGEVYRLFVLSAALKLDSAAIRARFDERKSRFASRDELMERTGLVPGSVPPFGRPILPFELFVDGSITRNDRIAFNAGLLTESIIMPVEAYLRLAKPEVFAFSLPE